MKILREKIIPEEGKQKRSQVAINERNSLLFEKKKKKPDRLSTTAFHMPWPRVAGHRQVRDPGSR